MRLFCFCLAGMAALAATGCRPAPEAPRGAAAVGAIRVVDEKQFAAVLEENRGKVVLVDFWATWCDPCRTLFPHTVALQRRYGDQGLVVLPVSLDEPSDQESVARFLASQEADFPSFISHYGTSSRSIEAFQVGEGAIPYLRLYDRQGKVYKAFGAGAEEPAPRRVEEAVKELLARKPA